MVTSPNRNISSLLVGDLFVCAIYRCTANHPELPHSEVGSGTYRLLTWLLGSPRASTPRDRRWKLPVSQVRTQKLARRITLAMYCMSQSSAGARPGERRGRRQPHLPTGVSENAAGCHAALGCRHVTKGLVMGAVPPALEQHGDPVSHSRLVEHMQVQSQ